MSSGWGEKKAYHDSMAEARHDKGARTMLIRYLIRSLAMAEIRLVLVRMIWEFDMELCEDTGMEWVENNKAWLTWHKKPLLVKLVARHDGLSP